MCVPQARVALLFFLPLPLRPSKLRYECAILPMVAGGNLLTLMALAAQHTRSFLFGHNCDEETALFGGLLLFYAG